MTSQITEIRRQDYFPTMIFSATAGEETDKVNADLPSAIYAAREADRKGIERSNFTALGSWHSQNHLHREAAFAPITKLGFTVTPVTTAHFDLIAGFTSQGFDIVEYYARDHNRALLTKHAAAKASQNPLDPDSQ